MTPIVEGGDVVEPLRDRVLGRVVADDVYVPGNDDSRGHRADTLLDEKRCEQARSMLSVQSMLVRSPITCATQVSASARSATGATWLAVTCVNHRRGGRRRSPRSRSASRARS